MSAPDVERVEREPEAVSIHFCEEFDRELLDEVLAGERECCPFFLFDFDEMARRLRTTVREREQLPALEAMIYALGQADQARTQEAVAEVGDDRLVLHLGGANAFQVVVKRRHVSRARDDPVGRARPVLVPGGAGLLLR